MDRPRPGGDTISCVGLTARGAAPDAEGHPGAGARGEQAAAGADQALHALAWQQALPLVVRQRPLPRPHRQLRSLTQRPSVQLCAAKAAISARLIACVAAPAARITQGRAAPARPAALLPRSATPHRALHSQSCHPGLLDLFQLSASCKAELLSEKKFV